ncbi:MAG TPA: BON domain-containing protein [Vicinamibacterales bacterium]|nr:BON domain-containing protein [Vicinamibacterales bacterium]
MAVVRGLLISILIILVAFVGFAYWSGTAYYHVPRLAPSAVAGTSGVLDDAEISSKIKAKMVLDDYVKARSISVNTKDGTVTLRGVVRSVDEHERALTLARDTVGVTQVVDELRVEAQ